MVLIELNRKRDGLAVGAGCTLVILLAVFGAVLNLRGLVVSEMEAATVEVAGRFEDAAASIRRDIRAGMESSDCQIPEIRRLGVASVGIGRDSLPDLAMVVLCSAR